MNESHLYPIEVFWSDEDEGYIALAPDLPGCSAWGEDAAAAVTEIRSAIEAWIEAAKSAGNSVPAPSRPSGPEKFSGKFLLRTPRQLHADLTRCARSENVSLNQYLIYVLSAAVARSTASANQTEQYSKYDIIATFSTNPNPSHFLYISNVNSVTQRISSLDFMKAPFGTINLPTVDNPSKRAMGVAFPEITRRVLHG